MHYITDQSINLSSIQLKTLYPHYNKNQFYFFTTYINFKLVADEAATLGGAWDDEASQVTVGAILLVIACRMNVLDVSHHRHIVVDGVSV